VLAPAATPREIVTRLNQEIVKALAAPELRERLTAAGVEPWPSTPEEFASLVRSETVRYADIIRRAGLHMD
jgi:tripartite-type tricarboxylate transporter receptor subunit TctC